MPRGRSFYEWKGQMKNWQSSHQPILPNALPVRLTERRCRSRRPPTHGKLHWTISHHSKSVICKEMKYMIVKSVVLCFACKQQQQTSKKCSHLWFGSLFLLWFLVFLLMNLCPAAGRCCRCDAYPDYSETEKSPKIDKKNLKTLWIFTTWNSKRLLVDV